MRKTLFTLCFAYCLLCVGCNVENNSDTSIENSESKELKEPNNSSSKFIHVVYFWLQNPDSQMDRAEFEKSLKTFMDNSEYAQNPFIGTPANTPREVVDNSWDYNLIIGFESAEQQDLYQKEAAHLKFVEDAAHLWDRVVVYDALKEMK